MTLIATVTSSVGTTAPSGAITFENRGETISGCAGMSVAPTGQSVTVVCQTSFAATTALLDAVFTPAAGSTVAGSMSATNGVQVGQDASLISLDAAKTVTQGASTTFTATVTPPQSRARPIEPSGTVEFFDGDTPIASCLSQELLNGGATCTVTYNARGKHSITARYGGDANFTGSASPPGAIRVVPVPIKVHGTITSTMQWTFAYTPAYTKILALVVNGAPAGATVLVKCAGRGCPYAKSATTMIAGSRCKGSGKRVCSADPSLNLRGSFRWRRLHPGTTITVVISRPGWIGKCYIFAIRPRRGPRIRISCLAPGGVHPGVGC